MSVDYSGIVPTIYHWVEHTGEIVVERVQPDVEPVMDRCKAMQAMGWDGYNNDRSMKAIAEVPITVVEQWAKEGIDFLNPAHTGEILKRLRDPALRHFRLDTGASKSGVIVKGAK